MDGTRDEHVFIVQADIPDRLAQENPRSADEGPPCPRLLFSLRFSYEQNMGIGISFPGHHLFRTVLLTELALRYLAGDPEERFFLLTDILHSPFL